MLAKDAFELHYSKLPEFAGVVFAQFRDRLRDHRNEADRRGWRKFKPSAARDTMLGDMQPGGYLFGKADMSAKVAFEHYSALPEFVGVVFAQFEDRLKAYRKNAGATPKTANVKWSQCPGQEMLLEDLQPGGILFEKDHVPAEIVFQAYKTLPEFEGVGFKQFKARLKDHQKQGNVKSRVAKEEMVAFIRDTTLHPVKKWNERGELKFNLHPAKLLLRKDVCNQVHASITPFELQMKRPEYMEFKRDIFRFWIKQEIRLQKYFNHRDDIRLKKLKGRTSGPRTHIFE